MLLRVQVGRHRVRQETRLHQRHGHSPPEAPAAMPDIEEHAALPAVDQRLTGSERLWILFAAIAAIDVRENVAGSKDFVEQVVERAFRAVAAEIHHHRNVRDLAHLDRASKRIPLRTRVMRALHPDDDAFVFEGHFRGRLHLHVVEVLLVLAAGLAEPDDVDHREDPGPGTVDDPVFHVLEVAPAGAARVDEGRDAVAKAEAVGIDGLVFGGEAPAIGGPVGVRVDVDESGSDVETLDVDRLERLRCRDVGRHGGNLAVLDRHITDGAQVVPAVDDMPPLQEQVVAGRRLR